MTVYIGIDPGKKGAACLISGEDIRFITWSEDEDSTADQLRYWCTEYDISLVCIEKVGSMPGQGVKSMFSFGDNNGWWRGAMKVLGLGVIHVRPQKWQKEMLDDRSGDIKIKSVSMCNDLTGLGLKLTKNGIDNGKADAYHLARYAKKIHKEAL